MAKKRIKKLYIELSSEGGTIISGLFSKKSKKAYFSKEDVELLRKLLSNEKSKILYFLRKEEPSSIYNLAKTLKRDFKSVYQDLKILERFGFLEFVSEKKGKRVSLKPELLADEIQLIIDI